MAVLSCLDGLIGIRGECGTPTVPTSNVYIQDIPFMTIKNADAGINEEMKSGFELIQDKMAFAKKLVVDDVTTFFSSRIKTASVIESETLGYFRDNLELINSEPGYYKGINIRVDQYPYLELFLSSVTLQLDASINTNIYVIDLISGTIIDTVPITTVANVPTEKIFNKSYRTNKQRLNLFICFDSGVAGSYTNYLTPSVQGGCDSCMQKGYRNTYLRASTMRLSTGDTMIFNNLSGTSNASGISITYSLSCALEPFVCTIANKIALPILYKSASEILKELKYSRRLNSIVTIHSKDIEELQMEYENEYNSRMERLLERVSLPDDICFRCSPRVYSNVRIP
jgi:hypothetical protein